MFYFAISLVIFSQFCLQVLDDNQELFIAETQELVKENPNFMLFGTQNPPGACGGRKVGCDIPFQLNFTAVHILWYQGC